MDNPKRFALTFLVAGVLFLATQYLLDWSGWLPKPPAPDPVAGKVEGPEKAGAKKAQGADKAKAAEIKAAGAKDKPKPADGAKPDVAKAEPPKVKEVDSALLVLGSLDDKSGQGYRLQVRLDQVGAGVASLATPLHEAEFDPKLPRKLQRKGMPLEMIEPDLFAPPSFALNVASLADPKENEARSKGAARLDSTPWEVVLDAKGRAVRDLAADDQGRKGHEITFKTAVGEPPVTITKTFRLRERTDGLELILGFASPQADRTLVYRLDGPHGIPIEGEWYTSTFREVFVGQANGRTTQVDTKTAYDVANKPDQPERYQALPLRYAGVENQYFAVLLKPEVANLDASNRWEEETSPTLVHIHREDKQKSDVSVRITSKPIEIGPNRSVTQAYRIFAGPKTVAALAPFAAEELASYRKGWQLPVIGPAANALSKYVIAPLLTGIYGQTAQVAHTFGIKNGSYGVAIILLTVLVRLALFPLSRKQAMSAKKMQDLQPQLVEMKEKYKDDKERQGRETLALYRQNGVNPFGGCLLALVQLPIFIGLWQALNNSVALRHAPFLYIQNLAAPDMLWRFPVTIPFLGDYFNFLPFVVVGLMLFQMKLFTPPPATQEAEMQMKMMQFMMVFMAFMFYKVPSGLGVYFITSSTWAICERLLLPKTLRKTALPPPSGDSEGNGKKAANGDGRLGPANGKPNWFDKLREKYEQLQEEASKDRTHRNDDTRGRESNTGGRDPNRPRPKPPGRKR